MVKISKFDFKNILIAEIGVLVIAGLQIAEMYFGLIWNVFLFAGVIIPLSFARKLLFTKEEIRNETTRR